MKYYGKRHSSLTIKETLSVLIACKEESAFKLISFNTSNDPVYSNFNPECAKPTTFGAHSKTFHALQKQLIARPVVSCNTT